jgi:hypothetical protein
MMCCRFLLNMRKGGAFYRTSPVARLALMLIGVQQCSI